MVAIAQIRINILIENLHSHVLINVQMELTDIKDYVYNAQLIV